MSDCVPSVDDLAAKAAPPLVWPVVPNNLVSLAVNGSAFGKDCAGADLPAQDINATVKTIPDPDAVQKVSLCNPTASLTIEFSETLLYSAAQEFAIMRIRQYDEVAGVWTLTHENLDGTPFVGVLPGDLVARTAQVNVARTAVIGNDGLRNYVQAETTRFDAETGNLDSTYTEWIDENGIASATLPANFKLGQLPEAKTSIFSGALPTVAGANTPIEFDGSPDQVNTSGIVTLQSITVTAKGVTDGPNSIDQILVTLPNGTVFRMFNGQTFTWSVVTTADSNLSGIYTVIANGAAYANVSYTYK